jgi:ATP synthase F1 delta subunit
MATKGTNKPLAMIYGQALYEAARDANSQAQVKAELDAVKELLHKDPKAGIFLETPTIAFDDKRRVIGDAFKSFSAITRNFLLVIAERGRAAMLDQIVDAYNEFADKTAGIAKVEVRSARKLEDSERAQLLKILEGKLNKKVSLDEQVLPELIGGIVLRHEDKLWDGSLRHRLHEFIQRMEAAPAHVANWSESTVDYDMSLSGEKMKEPTK